MLRSSNLPSTTERTHKRDSILKIKTNIEMKKKFIHWLQTLEGMTMKRDIRKIREHFVTQK